MKRNNKKGFTIVELVIVIAVIAILAGVLIPTFAGVISKANESKALQEAKNAYTADLALLDGQAENYNNTKYQNPVYAATEDVTPADDIVYYTLTNEKYEKFTGDTFDSETTYYTVTSYTSICKGTFSGENYTTYTITVDDEYECTYDGDEWTVKKND